MLDAAERQFTAAQRDKAATAGKAMPGGGFPILTAKDLKNAIAALGRAKDPAAAKAHIIKRARALKLVSMLPDEWHVGKAQASESDEFHGRATEILPASEAVFSDNAEGLPQADVVIIRAGESANRRFYPKEAIAEAVRSGFWDNTPMFADHGDPKMPRKRLVRDLMGRIDSTYLGQEGEARARITFLNPEFAAFARRAQSNIGLSAVHEFMGQRHRGNDGHMHERVDKFLVNHSVDFVAFPAAGGQIAQFLPAQESEDDVDWNELDVDMLKEHRPDLVEALAATSDGGSDGAGDEGDKGTGDTPPAASAGAAEAQGLTADTEKRIREIAQEAAEKVRTEYAEREAKQAATRAAVSAHLGKSGLPEKTRTRLMAAFEGQTEYVEATVQEAIDGAVDELKATGWHGPTVKGLGSSAAHEGDDKGTDPATLAKKFPTMAAVEAQMAFVPRSGKKADSDSTGKAN